MMARPLALLEKLIQGESSNPELFNVVEKAVLSSQPHDEMFEVNIVSQILYHLGYLKKSDLAVDKKSLIKAINEGLQASHL